MHTIRKPRMTIGTRMSLLVALLTAVLSLLPFGAAQAAATPPSEVISAGGYHTCALTPAGAADCWGNNSYGQAGDQPGPYTQISAGAFHTCALTPAGAVDCWGDNSDGQAADQPGPYTQISVGGFHTCALTPSSAADCWGYNESGRADDQPGPYTQISAGQYSTCALTPAGAAHCWGDNSDGQAGDQPGPYTQISVGGLHSCALTPSSAVHCWGDNSYGQAGDQPGPYTQISAGLFYTCALTPAGAADCWGDNSEGQAGDQPGPYTQISAGAFHTCALTPSGAAHCWGKNASGQAGDHPGPYVLSSSLDTTPPAITASATKADGSAYTAGSWTNQTVTVHFTCDDTGGSGVASCPSEQLFSAEGSFSAQGSATDKAGNTAAASFGPIQIDKSAPSVSASATKADGSAYTAGSWTNQTVTVHFTCTDTGGSGVASCPSEQLFSADGSFSAQGSATDTAGNTAAASFGPIQIDKRLPTISASTTKADGAPYTPGTWTNQTVTVHFTCNDSGGSGVATCATDQVISAEGTSTVQGSVRDNAGNTSMVSGSIKIDKSGPSISAAATSAPNAAGWYNVPVIVHFTCADPLSGIPSGACPADQTLSAEGAAVAATAQTVSDSAGNTSAPSNGVTVKIDRTAPTLNPSISPTPIRVGQSASATPNATDALSGIASQSCGALNTSTAGTKSVTCTATDNAGNSASVNLTYIVLPAFPTTSVLDTFNRANGGVGGSWEGLSGTNFYKIAANTLDVQLGGPLVWKPSSFGTTQEAFVTLSTIDVKNPSQGLLLKVQTGTVPNAGAISVVYDATAKAVRVSALRLERNGAWTLYANQAATFVNGDQLGARAKADGTVQIYKNGTPIASVTLSAADQAFFNGKGGKIGIWTVAASNAVLDDFGGGTVTP